MNHYHFVPEAHKRRAVAWPIFLKTLILDFELAWSLLSPLHSPSPSRSMRTLFLLVVGGVAELPLHRALHFRALLDSRSVSLPGTVYLYYERVAPWA